MPTIWPSRHDPWRCWVDAGTTNSSTTNAWPYWCANSTTAATAGQVYTPGQAWVTWNEGGVVRHQQVWVDWNTTQITHTGYARGGYIGHEMPGRSSAHEFRLDPPSLRDRSILETRKRAAAMRKRIAERRAEALLSEFLTDEQRTEWESDKCFHVETADGRRRYRISRGVAGNIRLVREGDRVASPGGFLRRYCAHIYGDYPVADNVLTQKLLLEANEPEFLRLANVG